MKCAACGMPLSPNRQQANCPKCGAPLNWRAGQKDASGSAQHGFPVGFTIAGLCILAGAFLLILVYVLAVGGPGNQQNTNTAQQITPRPTAVPSQTGISSPTATALPGQQYIDNVQISSSPPPNLQITNTIKKGQNFYVVFDLHPDGQSGVVCLVWYLNGQKANSYTIPVGVHSTSNYGLEIFGSAGSGSVNLYWATDATCSNELLAQQITFTVIS